MSDPGSIISHAAFTLSITAITISKEAYVEAPVVELTASTFLLRRNGEEWNIGLIWHDRLACRLPAGGHCEQGESLADAAVREVLEETGLTALLIPGPSAPVPPGFPHRPVPAPWWTVSGPASADSHTATEHVHVDHIFLALIEPAASVQTSVPDHQLDWLDRKELAQDPNVSDDSRILALRLLTWLTQAPAAAESDPDLAAEHLVSCFNGAAR